MKLGQLLLIKDTIVKILNSDLPIKEAYRLSKMTETVFTEIGHVQSFRDQLLAKYGTPSEDGNIMVGQENKEEFLEKYNELLDQDFEGDLIPLDLEVLDNAGVKLSPINVRVLMEVGLLEE